MSIVSYVVKCAKCEHVQSVKDREVCLTLQAGSGFKVDASFFASEIMIL